MAVIPEELFRFSVKEIARLCKVSERTANRWKDGTRCPPETALMILRGDLECLHPAWAGWVISARGELCSPENWICTPGQVRALQIKEAQVAALQHQVLELKMELEDAVCHGLEEQPLPEAWEIATG
jgi:hypothetical protein